MLSNIFFNMMRNMTIFGKYLTKGGRVGSSGHPPIWVLSAETHSLCLDGFSNYSISKVISQNLVLLSPKCTILPKLQFVHHTIMFSRTYWDFGFLILLCVLCSSTITKAQKFGIEKIINFSLWSVEIFDI